MGLIRLIIFTAVAFGAGVLFERAGARERCDLAGGEWTRTTTGARVCASPVTGEFNG
ncbi:hypothetical protein [Tritonibacter multivorans]|uniref:hypothetical protein n=1 Tax=Tritonibacter multivorans TaxID=928856 RepID=UPI0013F4DCC9|nr:hypothetical protein [Tritonibacter multivorans]